MTKTQMVAHIATELGISKKLAAELVNTFLESIMNGVKKHEQVSFSGFGTFKISHRKARQGVNPQNPSQKIQIPAMDIPAFKAGSDFKKLLRAK